MITFSDQRQKSTRAAGKFPAAFSVPNPFISAAAGLPNGGIFPLSPCGKMSCFAESFDTNVIET